jgi:hypothetical protein
MARTAAVVWHASFSIIAAGLYFFFVLPRWPELMGQTSPTLGTVLRIVTGALVGLAALPVVFTLLRTRRPEFGTPQLALTLCTASIALHVFAGALIIGTAISEIWLTPDRAGQWLFGIYGAAAAIALLGMFAFHLSFVAELPPPPPKPLKSKEKTRRRSRRKAADEEATEETEEQAADNTETSDATSAEETEKISGADGTEDRPAEETDSTAEDVTSEPTSTAQESLVDEGTATSDAEAPNGRLRNRRPSGKTALARRRRRQRGGIAVDD